MRSQGYRQEWYKYSIHVSLRRFENAMTLILKRDKELVDQKVVMLRALQLGIDATYVRNLQLNIFVSYLLRQKGKT